MLKKPKPRHVKRNNFCIKLRTASILWRRLALIFWVHFQKTFTSFHFIVWTSFWQITPSTCWQQYQWTHHCTNQEVCHALQHIDSNDSFLELSQLYNVSESTFIKWSPPNSSCHIKPISETRTVWPDINDLPTITKTFNDNEHFQLPRHLWLHTDGTQIQISTPLAIYNPKSSTKERLSQCVPAACGKKGCQIHWRKCWYARQHTVSEWCVV